MAIVLLPLIVIGAAGWLALMAGVAALLHTEPPA